jgi:hypothetical protein
VFMRRAVGDEGYDKPVEMGQTFSGVIVGVRMELSYYKPGEPIISSTEYSNTNTEKIALFQREKKGAQPKKLDDGTPVSLKGKYPKVRTQMSIYMLLNGDIVKFKVKGAGMSHWFKFLKDLAKKKQHLFAVRVKLDPALETNEEIGKEYYVPVFTIEKELTDDEIEKTIQPHIEKLAQEFEAIAKYREQQKAVTADELPTVQLDESGMEDLPPLDELE